MLYQLLRFMGQWIPDLDSVLLKDALIFQILCFLFRLLSYMWWLKKIPAVQQIEIIRDEWDPILILGPISTQGIHLVSDSQTDPHSDLNPTFATCFLFVNTTLNSVKWELNSGFHFYSTFVFFLREKLSKLLWYLKLKTFNGHITCGVTIKQQTYNKLPFLEQTHYKQ